ncbi:MAG TPA: xanthan lyase, partial [Verrucomicrobiales bacterium]|nr:xanthan lyase [Verrucomicrobiales bacterium]
MRCVYYLLLLATLLYADAPRLPRPDQVDKPENIKFIIPDKSKLAGIVVDDVEAKLVGDWKHSIHTPPFVGKSYIHDMKEKKGKKSATFIPNLP